MLDTDSTLLNSVKDFLAKTGMSRTQFGYSCMGDPAFVTKLERGRKPRESTRQVVLQFIKRRLKGGK